MKYLVLNFIYLDKEAKLFLKAHTHTSVVHLAGKQAG